MDNTPASYSEGREFKSRPVDRQFWLKSSWFPSVPPGQCRYTTLRLGTTASSQILSNSSFIYLPFIPRFKSELLEKRG
jgi:hypothetical protein